MSSPPIEWTVVIGCCEADGEPILSSLSFRHKFFVSMALIWTGRRFDVSRVRSTSKYMAHRTQFRLFQLLVPSILTEDKLTLSLLVPRCFEVFLASFTVTLRRRQRSENRYRCHRQSRLFTALRLDLERGYL